MIDHRTGVMLDLDGTLVDSVFHHVMAWEEAFATHDLMVPLWRVHAAIGMGSDRLVPWVLGRPYEGLDELKREHEERFLARANGLHATNGARELLDDLEGRAVPHIIATSSTNRMKEALLAALGWTGLEVTSGDDVQSTKPSPEPILVACARLDLAPNAATLVGDSPWDAEAASRVGVRTLAVRCGGFGDDALSGAGAIAVVDDPRALVGRL